MGDTGSSIDRHENQNIGRTGWIQWRGSLASRENTHKGGHNVSIVPQTQLECFEDFVPCSYFFVTVILCVLFRMYSENN